MDEDREAEVSCWGRRLRLGRSVEEEEITVGEIKGAIEKTKCGKEAREDDIMVRENKRIFISTQNF